MTDEEVKEYATRAALNVAVTQASLLGVVATEVAMQTLKVVKCEASQCTSLAEFTSRLRAAIPGEPVE